MNLIIIGKVLGVAGFIGGTFGLGMLLRPSEDNNAYIYVSSISKLDTDNSSSPSISEFSNFLCQFEKTDVGNESFDCEIFKIDSENNQHKVGKATKNENKLSTIASAKTSNIFFQIKFNGEVNWKKLGLVKDEFKIFEKGNTSGKHEYATLIMSAATYKQETKTFKKIVGIVQATSDSTVALGGLTSGTEKTYKCSFEAKGKPKQEKDCKISNFSESQDVSANPNYETLAFKTPSFTETINVKKNQYYSIQLISSEGLKDFDYQTITINEGNTLATFKVKSSAVLAYAPGCFVL